MATQAKRAKVDEGAELRPLQAFLQWCDGVGLQLSPKVCVSTEGTVADYGLLALDHIQEDEVLFTVPRSALLHQNTTKISALLEKEKSSLESGSGWVPLLLTLLYESTSPQSPWKPYLSLWSDFTKLDLPMFWCKEERDALLKGTGVPEAVDRDVANIQQEYADVALPFMLRHPDLWSPQTHTLELYTQLVAFAMAYSFTEGDEDEDNGEPGDGHSPMMVPMADMLNHTSNHNANLEFTPECLKMVSVRPIRRGQEVFNTYGEKANWQLLHMYGFAEPYPSNAYDGVGIPVSSLYQAVTQGVQSQSELQQLKARWKLVDQVVNQEGVFVYNKQGFWTDVEMHMALKVLDLSEDELSEFQRGAEWEEDYEDESVLRVFTNEGLPRMKGSWKRRVHDTARIALRSYGDGEEELEEILARDRALMEDRAALAGLSCRQQKALHVRYGQKCVLHKLLQLTQA